MRVAASRLPADGRITTTENAERRERGTMTKYKTEAVLLQMAKEEKDESEAGTTVKCQLKPVAGGTAIEIDGSKYLVGCVENGAAGTADPPADCGAWLWELNSAGVTKTEFEFADGLEQWALAAWQARRKVRLVADGNKITKITLP